MTMKLRNRLIALVCLILFLSLGGLIFATSGPKKPFAVILFVADNINPAALAAARLYSGGGESRLQIEEFPNAALCRNSSSDFSVPDTASASTQIACGKKTPNGKLGIDSGGATLPSLLEVASLRGRSTALITTGGLSAPGAAAFFAKSADAANRADLLAQFGLHAPLDFVAATSSAEDSPKADQLPKETLVARTSAELDAVPLWKRTPVAALLPPAKSARDADSPSLAELVRTAIRRLQFNGKGYLLVVEDPSVASAASANNAEQMLGRIEEFDKAVATARRYAGENSLIVVTGRENIAGFQLNGRPFLRDKGVAVLALNNLGYPSICWATGPGYAVESGDKKKGAPGILAQPSAFPLAAGVPTSGDVLTAGYGPGSAEIHGFLDLTDIHRILSDSL